MHTIRTLAICRNSRTVQCRDDPFPELSAPRAPRFPRAREVSVSAAVWLESRQELRPRRDGPFPSLTLPCVSPRPLSSLIVFVTFSTHTFYEVCTQECQCGGCCKCLCFECGFGWWLLRFTAVTRVLLSHRRPDARSRPSFPRCRPRLPSQPRLRLEGRPSY